VIVLTRLGRQLELAIPQESVLPVLVETVAQMLKLPYVAIALRTDGEVAVAAEYGRSSGNHTELPLVYQGEHIGKLLVAKRGPGEPFSPGEMDLLANIARQAGAAAHSVQMTADLQRSRQRLVTAREEERRRLRRDLHDGLGPALAAHLLKIGSARVLLKEEPDEAEQLLDELEGDVESTVVEIRHLVYDLRPPELDQLGLVGAIEQYVSQYSLEAYPTEGGPGRSGVNTTVNVPEVIPPLPAAVEVAAYRIVQEGLNNVLSHAQARRCTITLSMNSDVLELNLGDDGQGFAAGNSPGIGLMSMRERAEELGGSCQVTGQVGGGTQVLVLLPLIDLEQDGQEH
jgi:signal transduction histidine kinase